VNLLIGKQNPVEVNRLKSLYQNFREKNNFHKPARTGGRDFCKKVIKFRFREKIPISAFLTDPGFREEIIPFSKKLFLSVRNYSFQ